MEDKYGVKLSMDITDFQKKMKEAQKELEKTENTRKIKVTGTDDFTITLKDNIKETEKAFENLASVKDRIESGQIKITGLSDNLDFDKISAEYEAMREKMSRPLEATMKTVFDDEPLKQGLENTKIKADETTNDIKNEFSIMVNEIKAKTSSIGDGFSQVKKVFSNIGNSLKNVKNKLLDVGKAGQKAGNSVSQSFNNGIKSLKRFALSLFGVQSAYRVVTKAVSSYLQYDQQLSESIQNTWAGLGSFLAPVLEYLVGLFSKLLGYINAVVQALTGINFVARANAKAMSKAGKSASGAGKQAQKALAPFDELNNIKQETSSGGGGGGSDVNPIQLPEIDQGFVNKILGAIDKIKKVMATIFDPIKKAWEEKGPELVRSMQYAFESTLKLVGDIGKSMLDVWTNGTGQKMTENMLEIFTNIFDIIGNISTALDNAWNKNNTGTQIIQSIANIFMTIQKFAISISDTLKKWTASPEFQKALDVIFKIISDILKYIDEIAKWILKMWNEYVKPVLDEKIMPLVGDLSDLIKAIWDNVLKPLVENIKTVVKPIIESVIKGFMKQIGNILDILSGITKFLTGVFTGDWKKAFEGIKKIVTSALNFIKDAFSRVFNNLWSIVKGILNFIIIGFENMVNFAIKGINSLLKPLTKVGNTVLKAVGIKNFSFSVIPNVKLPRLKVGTDLVYEEGLAYLHKGEKVVPADVAKGGYNGSDNEETNSLLRQLIDAVNDKDYNPYITVDDIGKASVNYIRKKSRIEGEAIL